MFTLKSAAILALVGSAFAAPLARRDEPKTGRMMQGWDYDGTKVVYVPDTTTETVVVETTVVVVPYTGGSSSGSQNFGSSNTGATSASGSTGTSTGSSTGASGTGYMAVVNEWRSKGGLPALTQSSKLEANALKTAQDGNGQMVHELNPGTFAQVLAPGTASNFESVYVGGWLCEVPSLPGLNGACSTMTKGWDHSNGETGHADILTSTKYTTIGCSLADGIWACDLA